MKDLSLEQLPYSDDPEEEFHDEDLSSPTAATDLSRHPLPSEIKRPRSKVWWAIGLVCILGISSVLASRVVNKRYWGPMEQAMAQLEMQGVSLASAWEVGSPQFKAVEWMVHQDTLKLGTEDPGFVQRYILATLVFAVADPSTNHRAATLQDSLHFLSELHECQWQSSWESSSRNFMLAMGIHCNGDQVTKVILPTVGLKGQLPRELGSLKSLDRLMVDVNQITGQIPFVPSLVGLSMAYNRLEGSIPPHLGLMTKLEDLILTENLLTGHLPEELQDLTNLKRLALSSNEFSSGLPNVLKLTNLEELYAAFNSFEDEFDNETFGVLTNLRVLDVQSNDLEGPVPNALWKLSQLRMASLRQNALSGFLHEIQDMHQPVLEYFDVSENFLGGGIPSSMNRVTALKYLDVSKNRFGRALPDLNGLTNLEVLLLADNGSYDAKPIPSWLMNMSKLKRLSLKLTGRTGTIPDWFVPSLRQLEVLDFEWNRLSGTIPTEMVQMTELEHLMLNRNLFSGPVPSNLDTLPRLKTILLDNNRLVGNLNACQATTIVADCGNSIFGCPKCDSITMEVDCPCCTACCYDGDEFCNTHDWLSSVLAEHQSGRKFIPTYHRPSDYNLDDSFVPKSKVS